ncbi:hypothetical protein [Thalassoglobus neptunius]|nr:hypothetical protein [Thalassoglobus neptunius]
MEVLQSSVGKEISEGLLASYSMALKDLPIESVSASVQRIIMEDQYPVLPTPGRLRKFAVEFTHGCDMSHSEAFDQVKRAISKCGYNQPKLAEQMLGESIWRAIQGIGGWDRVCSSPVSERSSLVAQFRDSWNHVAEDQQRKRMLPEGVRPKVIGAAEKTLEQKSDNRSLIQSVGESMSPRLERGE